MWYEISRADNVCTNIPHLLYHTMRAGDDQVKNLTHIGGAIETIVSRVQLHKRDSFSKGTYKYIYFHRAKFRGSLEIWDSNVSFPFMLYEGSSCLYGGIFIVQTLLSMESEIISLCTPVSNSERYRILIDDLRNVSVVIIHYSEYSTEKIAFYARYQYKFYWHLIYDLNMKDETIEFTVPTFPNSFAGDGKFFISSHQLNLRNIHYINITFENKNIIRFVLSITYGTLEVHNHSWFHTTVFYSPHPSNIKGRQYDVEMIDMYHTRTVTRIDFIQFIFISMSTSNIFDAPVWYLHITKDEYTYNYIMNTSYFTFLTTDFLQKSYKLGFNSLWGRGEIVRSLPPIYGLWSIW